MTFKPLFNLFPEAEYIQCHIGPFVFNRPLTSCYKIQMGRVIFRYILPVG